MSLTQHLESQEYYDMTRPLNFLELKRGEEMGFFVCWLYSSGGENMNGMPFNEG